MERDTDRVARWVTRDARLRLHPVLLAEDPPWLQHNVRGMTFLPSIWKRVFQPAMPHLCPRPLVFAVDVAVRGLAREPAAHDDGVVLGDVGQMSRVSELREGKTAAVLPLLGRS